MSLNFIHNFQRRVHYVLSTNDKVRSRVKNIYLSAVQDGQYPFLVLNIQKATDISRFAEFIYEIDFEISAFARGNHNQGFLLSLSNEISRCLTPKECGFDQYLVAGLSLADITFEKAGDLLSTKLTMNYKSLIKGGRNL
jgi:hypothetical protein